MATKKKSVEKVKTPSSPPARNPENRENQLVELAYNLAEQRLRDGTASAQEVVHFLRMGAAKTQLEKKKLEIETELAMSKKELIESNKRSEEKYQQALDAFRIYNGQVKNDDVDV